MLGGAPAFAGSSLAEVVYKVVHAQAQPLAQLRAGLPLNVLSAVDRALQKDPAHRPADVSAFVAELTGRPLTVPAASSRASSLDATLASPAQPIPLSNSMAETDATFTPATPVPVPRVTSPMSGTPPARPLATPPLPANAPSAWPAQGATGSAPRAELITQPEQRGMLAPSPKPKRHVARWVIIGLVVLAFFGVFRRRHVVDVGSAVRMAQALSKEVHDTTPSPPSPPSPPNADDAEDATQQLKKGFEEVKKNIREALAAEGTGREAEKAAAEKLRVAKVGEGRPGPTASGGQLPASPPEVSELLSDAEDALGDEDPKLALRLADQSFFAKKTSAGWAIKARAHCQLKDLGNARAALANVTGKAARAQVVADCKEHGVNLR
jgi:eukaryotic-like serine/threonine-protein kinase